MANNTSVQRSHQARQEITPLLIATTTMTAAGEEESSTSSVSQSRSNMSPLSTVLYSLKRLNYRLYLALIFRLMMPTIYSTFRVAILGTLPDTGPLSIASQMAWVSVLLEIIEEGLLLPLYHCLGTSIADRGSTKNKVKTGFLVSLVIYVLFSSTVAALAWPLVRLMGQSEELQEETVDYIRLELIGIVAGSLAKLLMLVMILHKWNAMLYLTLFVQMASSMTLDFLLVSQMVADLGTSGVAYSSIGTSNLVLLVSLAIVWVKLGFSWDDLTRERYDYHWFRRWTRVGFFSALDSLIRNSVYLVVIIRAMNLLEEQDSYWICNTFIWNWMLLPALPLTDLLKQDVSDGSQEKMFHWKKTSGYAAISFVIFVFWAASYPLWDLFIVHVLKAPEPEVVEDLALLLMPCYTFLVLGNLMKSVFYALGRTDLLAFAAFIGNSFLVVLFVLVLRGLIPNTVMAVAAIFGAGLVVGFFITSGLYVWLIRRRPML